MIEPILAESRRCAGLTGWVAGAVFVASCLLSESVFAASMTSSVVPAIDISETSTGLRIVGRVLALTEGTFDATLALDKKGPSGTMKTRQGSRLTLTPGTSGNVATIGVSFQPGDSLDVRLEVKVDGEMVARTYTSVH